jgi:hypothetical protein
MGLGGVKVVKRYRGGIRVEQEGEIVSTNERVYEIEEYDRNGRLEKIIAYMREDSSSEERSYKYDESGKLIEEIYRNIADGLNQRYLFDYNADGSVTETHYYADGFFDKTVKRYENEKISRVDFYDDGETLAESETYQYDAAGNLVLKELKNSENQVLLHESYEYDAQSRLQKSSRREADGDRESVVYRYNEEGLCVAADHFIDDQLSYTVENEYNDANKVIKETIKDEGNAVSVTEFTYDDHGNTIRASREEISITSRMGATTTFKSGVIREYDAKNRLVREIHFDQRNQSRNYATRFEYEEY